MKTSRRTFVKISAAAAVGAALFPAACATKPEKKKAIVGLQLYSVRDQMTADPLGSLTEIAKMGYVHVEHANYVDRKFYGYTPQEFRKVLDDLGLNMVSGHTVFAPQHWDAGTNDFTDSWKYTVEDAAVLGQKYVVSPWMDESMRDSYDNLQKWMGILNKCGELCQKQGMKFGYHNHDFEFSQKLNDEMVFDLMMKWMDPKLVVMQIDIGNLYNGGAVALDVVKKYPGRFENVHVKDEIAAEGGNEKYESTIVGKGIVNAKEVVDLLLTDGGAEVLIIEQESYQGRPPMECMKENLEVMKSWGLV
ncbi:MAG: sugar phosphate isomerase/epimerase [Bacteroidales bacterium]|jgi:sugar phosphate isomerase/epimerase|nr:sugar phosphate isomerase/epimerase [Bacteroidales bacterium]MCU0407941.1 sugar phosphate isomerase/epimerase [Bacteroidales bacterium]